MKNLTQKAIILTIAIISISFTAWSQESRNKNITQESSVNVIQCFISRLTEAKNAGLIGAAPNFAASNHTMSEFQKRLTEAKNAGLIGAAPNFAASNHTMSEFQQRLTEAKNAGLIGAASNFAASNHTMSEFQQRLTEAKNAGLIGAAIDYAYWDGYGKSDFELCRNQNEMQNASGEFNQNQGNNNTNGNISSTSNNYEVAAVDYKSWIRPTTSHKGYFFDKFPGKSYFCRYIINIDQSDQESVGKNMFYKGDRIFPSGDLQFGAEKKYKNDELIIKKGDSLFLRMEMFGAVGNVKKSKGVWKGKAEYSISIQVEDSTKKEYYRESSDKVVEIANADIYKTSTNDVIITISPDMLQTFPESQDLYLSFFIQGKNKKQMLEGFLKFKVE